MSQQIYIYIYYFLYPNYLIFMSKIMIKEKLSTTHKFKELEWSRQVSMSVGEVSLMDV